MRKLELKLKMMRRKLNIESCDLEACLLSFGISQLGVLGWHCCPTISFRVRYCISPVHGWQSRSVKLVELV
jgi:hypothetical protein